MANFFINKFIYIIHFITNSTLADVGIEDDETDIIFKSSKVVEFSFTNAEIVLYAAENCKPVGKFFESPLACIAEKKSQYYLEKMYFPIGSCFN